MSSLANARVVVTAAVAVRWPTRRCGYLFCVLLSAEGSVVLLIDLQERLIPAMHDGDAVVARAVRVAQAARMLGVPVRATEQYPTGLGPTVAPLKPYP